MIHVVNVCVDQEKVRWPTSSGWSTPTSGLNAVDGAAVRSRCPLSGEMPQDRAPVIGFAGLLLCCWRGFATFADHVTSLNHLRPGGPMTGFRSCLALSAFLLVLLPCSLQAASLKEVADAVRTKDYAKALEQLDVLTRQKHPEAEFLMGMMYQYGRGVDQDLTKAATWFRRSAEQGNAAAQTNLALLLVSGKVGKPDFKEAVKLLEKASAAGNTTATYNLGLRYAKGEGVEKSATKASELYRAAAEANNPFAQYNLAYAYATGEGLAIDNVEALKWARLSAQQNFARAMVFHSFLSSKATPEEVQKAETLVLSWGKEKGVEIKPLPEIKPPESPIQAGQGDAADTPAP